MEENIMKFEFEFEKKVDIGVWSAIIYKLEQDLKEFANGNVKEEDAVVYVKDLCATLEKIGNGICHEMLFLRFDDPATMPADARVGFVYRPTYIAATIMMTAFCTYESIRCDNKIKEVLHKVLNATMGRNFLGAGYDDILGLLDTLQTFFEGSTVLFVEQYPEINEEFAAKIAESITFLETSICTGEIKDAWGPCDYSERGKQILAMI